MTPFLRIVLLGSCFLAASSTPGCGANVPLPLPDASRTSGLSLSATPDRLVIRPSSSGRVRFVLRDQQSLPVSDYPISFSIAGKTSDDASTSARLSSTSALTDGAGMAILEVIVGNLGIDDRPAAFLVQASCPGSAGAQADILVTTNAYSVEILPVAAVDSPGGRAITTIRLQFYDVTTCAELELSNLGASPSRSRSPEKVAPNTSFVFPGVAGEGSSAVVGQGLDSKNAVQIGGCVDVPGPSLLDSETIRATLYLDHLFPKPVGTFRVSSDFRLTPDPPVAPAAALTAARAVWQEWTRCPLDPARLWLDCTIDTLVSDAGSDPNDCIPVPGAEGPLGNLLTARRGGSVPALAGTLAATLATSCRGSTDGTGTTSLESMVADLFRSGVSRLASANLGALPVELNAILGEIHIDSALTLVQARETNSYLAKHELVRLLFPNASPSTAFDVAALGLPVGKAQGIVATLKNGQISLPAHAFTLRLGTTARYVFESTSLRLRGIADSNGLVDWVFGLAQMVDKGKVQTSCDALDALLCDEIAQPRGCLLSACKTGLDALSRKLAGAFAGLDGAALDFRLSGSAPVIDKDNDGLTDALGQAGDPGLWLGQIDSRSGNSVTYGSWTASVSTVIP